MFIPWFSNSEHSDLASLIKTILYRLFTIDFKNGIIVISYLSPELDSFDIRFLLDAEEFPAFTLSAIDLKKILWISS